MDFFDRFLESENVVVRDAARCGRLHAFFERLMECGDPSLAADELPRPLGFYYLDPKFATAVQRGVVAFHLPNVSYALMKEASNGNVNAIRMAFELIKEFKAFGMYDEFDRAANERVDAAPPVVVVTADTFDGAAKSGV